MAMRCLWRVGNNNFILCLVIALYCTSFAATQNVDFSYENFTSVANLIPWDDAEIYWDHIALNSLSGSNTFGVGRILYNEKVQFQDRSSMAFASFSTFFTFSVNLSNSLSGDGFAFIIVANNTDPIRPGGGSDGFSGEALGLLNLTTTNGNISNHIFAVEIDTYQNPNIQDPSSSHVGVDINSLISIATCDFCSSCFPSYFANQGIFGVWIDYVANNQTLHVAAQLYNESGSASTPPPCQIVVPNFTLTDVLIDDGHMYVGFSGSTGSDFEHHNIYSWRFSTSGLPPLPTPTPAPTQSFTPMMTPVQPPRLPTPTPAPTTRTKKSAIIWILSICGIIFMGAGILGAIFFFKTKARKSPHVLELGSRGNQTNYNINLDEYLGGPCKF